MNFASSLHHGLPSGSGHATATVSEVTGC